MTWQQFVASLLALGLVAAERLVNRYLPDRRATATPTSSDEVVAEDT